MFEDRIYLGNHTKWYPNKMLIVYTKIITHLYSIKQALHLVNVDANIVIKRKAVMFSFLQ